MIDPEYLTLKDLAAYASVSRNTLKKWQECGMLIYKVGGVLRVKRSEFDAWMRQFRVGTESKDLDAIFEQVLEEVRS